MIRHRRGTDYPLPTTRVMIVPTRSVTSAELSILCSSVADMTALGNVRRSASSVVAADNTALALHTSRVLPEAARPPGCRP